jgi:hypothetical protein
MAFAAAHAMRLQTSLGLYATSLLASLGLTHLASCGGTATARNTGPLESDAGKDSSAGGARADGTGGRATTTGAGTGGVMPHPGTGGRATGGAYMGPIDGEGGPGGSGAPPCRNSSPVNGVDGKPTGYERCEGGSMHRTVALACPSLLPTADRCMATLHQDGGPDAGRIIPECATDTDCAALPNGQCSQQWGGLGLMCSCIYGCRVDADCGGGQLCQCGDPIGHCVSASCKTDADCGPGLLCLSWDNGCGYQFSCQTPRDTCASDADCSGLPCTFRDGIHTCASVFRCVDGRPFLVEGAARVAPVASRSDWCSELLPDTAPLGAADRAAIGARWLDIAKMEHASIAAFARFALELLSLGAPPSLVAAANEAIFEETAHARNAFALASAYLGRNVGPGPLDVSGALASSSPLEIVRSTILEGCIGETVAAVEAAEALAEASDPAVRAALGRVVEEETRHAELAFRFVQWVLDHGAHDLASAAARELVAITEREASLALRVPEDSPRAPESWRAHGVVDDGTRLEIRRRVLAEVSLPCARALVESYRRRTSGRVATDGAKRATAA